ncbi:MAG: hypothetical protein QOK29_4268, partial [Rhodospirillaceae bacterium]|nr:hypothetical protein [Rhodospirillaceae bacterium]
MARIQRPVPPRTPATDQVSVLLRRGSNTSIHAPTEGSLATTPLLTNPIPVHGTAPVFTPGGRSGLLTSTALTPAAPTAAALPANPNPISQENQLPGNPPSEWEVNANSTNIEGFTTDISVNHGTTLNFKINTNSTNYRIDIYRLGYYGGNGARKVATLQHQNASAPVQPNPMVDTATGEVDAGNWSTTDSWNVPAAAVSGVYVANLVRQDGTAGVFQVPFIVRDDSSHSDVVFQTSDTTWQAYNGWGGANLYGGNGPGPRGAAYAVSYNRPIVTRDGVGVFGGPQDMVFGAEYAALRWMEQNGYDVSYIAGLDTARSGSLLLNHKIFTSTGHDEYWSGDQRANVEAARDAGVNLAFMSGNEVYWKTRWAPSIDGSNTPNRTMVNYKETHEFKLNAGNPSGTWTGTWRDPSFSPPGDGGKPENALTGQMIGVDSYRADIMKIPYGQTQLRFWRNAPLAQTQPGGTASLTQNLLGYEWDVSPDNGFRPGGLISLSSTTLAVSQYVADYGNVDAPATATHNLTLYRAPSGALVFGAGTVFWAWGLDSNHDLTATPTDRNVQQSMVNLFADMGVQPQTLQAGLAPATKSTDTTPPTSTITTPTGSNFPEGTYATITGSATDTGGGLVAGVEVSTDSGTSWHPAGGSAANWTYSWLTPAPGNYTIKARATDDTVNTETPGPGTGVTVTPTTTVSLFQTSDTPGTVTDGDTLGSELGVKFKSSKSGTITGFRFYKGPQNTGTHVGSLWSATGTLLGSATYTNETASGWQQVNLATPISITAGTTYVASYHTNVGHYSETFNYFVTPRTSGELTALASNAQNGPDGVWAHSGSSTFPGQGVESATNYFVDVVFNPSGGGGVKQAPVANADTNFITAPNTAMALSAATLLANDTDANGDTLTVTGVSAAANGTVSFANNTATFTPTNGYTGAANFTYSISDGNGGTASAQVSLSVGNSLWGNSNAPTLVTANDPGAASLGVKFTASSAGTINGIRFYKGPQNTGTHVVDLWSSTGTKLATGTAANETPSGWQEAAFTTPVSITAGTTYIAAYHTNTGFYSADTGYFNAARTTGPLTAPSTGTSGGNGVYIYSANDAFPTNSFQGSNYWVDPVFSPSAGGGGT